MVSTATWKVTVYSDGGQRGMSWKVMVSCDEVAVGDPWKVTVSVMGAVGDP